MTSIQDVLNNSKLKLLLIPVLFFMFNVQSFALVPLPLTSMQEDASKASNNNEKNINAKNNDKPQRKSPNDQSDNKVALNLAKVKLNQIEELAKHLSLAEQYATENKFELAYLEKESYRKKYRLYRKTKRKDMLEKLTKTYDVDEKNMVNKLLKNRNEVKLLRVTQIKEEQRSQRNYFIWIIILSFIFLLLFFKELKVRQKLIKLAKTDALTGVANRNTLFKHGQRLIKKHIAQPFDYSVLLLDIDYFKCINDKYGHQVGDQVLATAAELVNETMRSRDLLARLGGEEFVALLPYADENKAKAIAMRITEKIALHNFSSLGVNEKITLSIGVASMKKENNSFDDILHRADLAMYQAKKQGRNKVISYRTIATEEERRGI